MTLVQEKLGDSVGRDVFMYSITVDPKTDRPEQLKNYAEAFRIGPGLLGSKGGGWLKDSLFCDIERVVSNIRLLDPDWPQRPSNPTAVETPVSGLIEVSDKPGQALFIKASASCHTIGKGDRVGPDLAYVSARRSKEWLRGFVSRPDRMFAAGDPVALAMTKKYRGLRMPNLGLSEQDADDVIAYLDAQSFVITNEAKGRSALPDHSAKLLRP